MGVLNYYYSMANIRLTTIYKLLLFHSPILLLVDYLQFTYMRYLRGRANSHVEHIFSDGPQPQLLDHVDRPISLFYELSSLCFVFIFLYFICIIQFIILIHFYFYTF